ncbi:hypothetical protein BHE74_00013992 [Ensete ventricosum]|nr:hypothetical protein BHE74_00013992 [Ensete ventricosum]
MFKKPVEAKLLQRLSGADKKKLRRTAKERFPHASDANIDEILPPKVQKLVPSFLLKGGEVSRYVIGGADLMFPGISIPPEGLRSFLSGQPWAVKVPGNPAPIAVIFLCNMLVAHRSNHVLPCRPSGITLDIKKSSHKKLSKWLQSKSSAGLVSIYPKLLISAKEDKYKKEVMLLGINRGHQEFMTFKPEKRVPENAEQRHDNSVSEGAQTKLQLEVVEVYKPSTHVKSIFSTVGADTGSYYSASDAADIAFRYVEKENLVKPTDKAMVVLDATLCDALYKGTIKKGSTYPTEVHKKDLGSTFLSRMQIHHRVSKGNEVAVRKGAVRPIQIMTERRQGNKKVTRVSGLETFLMDADSLASELQKKFACSTSVAEIPGKKGQHEVLVQGGVIEDLAKHLVDHYGIPKRYIEVLDKTKK